MNHKNILKKIGALCVAGTLVIAPASSIMAATTYSAVSVTTNPTLSKYLIMDGSDSVPNVSFSFTIASGTAIAAQTEAWIYNNNEYATEAAAKTAADTHQGVAAGAGDYTSITHREATMAVLAGPTASSKPSIADATFQAGATTNTSAQSGDTDVARTNQNRGGTAGADAVQLDSGEKYAKATTTIDFTGVTFSEPGIYRYVITESANASNAAAGITNDTDTDRILDVYVTDNGSGVLVVSDCVLHTDATTVAANNTSGSVGGALTDKTDGFTNEMTGTKDLAIKKAVSGNQASKDKYFKFTVALGELTAGNSYVVSIADDSNASTVTDGNADASPARTPATKETYTSMSNPTSISVASGATSITQDFYLQDGQSVVIRGLPQNATYSVTEDPEDYKSTPATVTGYTDQTATDSTNGTIGAVAGTNKEVKTSFTNTRSGTIPTGIIATIWGGVLILLVGVVGFIFATKSKRKNA